MSVFSRYAIDTRPVEAMSAAQASLVLGLDTILREASLVLTCPRCAAEGHGTLQTKNGPGDALWKMDCQCRRRRIEPGLIVPMVATGWLLTLAEELLGPLSLAVRCPSSTCLLIPLELRQGLDTLTVVCQCSASRVFKKTSTTPH
jgi:hypothetical protein